MLYIKIENGVGDPTEYRWHVGEPAPFKYDLNLIPHVSYVQADGDELAYLISCTWNLPSKADKKVQRWYGDMAKFIAGNL